MTRPESFTKALRRAGAFYKERLGGCQPIRCDDRRTPSISSDSPLDEWPVAGLGRWRPTSRGPSDEGQPCRRRVALTATAFGQALTAFGQALTAFGQALTAFEQALTAFG